MDKTTESGQPVSYHQLLDRELGFREQIFQVAEYYARGADFESPKHLTRDVDFLMKPTVVMVAAEFVGPDDEKIAGVTGYTKEYVRKIGDRLRASGYWTNDGTDYQDWNDGTGLRHTMDVLVAEGQLFRAGDKRKGQYVYRRVPNIKEQD